ncbi:MAG: DUF448 domain-containing protein [Actinobacteria bacterium]|nr:DUF448 domain-containing protein [Actinomycetota bacterium]
MPPLRRPSPRQKSDRLTPSEPEVASEHLGGALESALGGSPGPVRTCIGCRGRAVSSDLLRVVAEDGQCLPDPRAHLPGRGAYIHPTVACFDAATSRRAWVRALRVSGPLDGTAVRAGLPPGLKGS